MPTSKHAYRWRPSDAEIASMAAESASTEKG